MVHHLRVSSPPVQNLDAARSSNATASSGRRRQLVISGCSDEGGASAVGWCPHDNEPSQSHSVIKNMQYTIPPSPCVRVGSLHVQQMINWMLVQLGSVGPTAGWLSSAAQELLRRGQRHPIDKHHIFTCQRGLQSCLPWCCWHAFVASLCHFSNFYLTLATFTSFFTKNMSQQFFSFEIGIDMEKCWLCHRKVQPCRIHSDHPKASSCFHKCFYMFPKRRGKLSSSDKVPNVLTVK
jgi:hypothetical protein